MSFFDRLSDILTRRSPRRPALSPQNSPHSVPPSDATSDHLQRTETSGAWNAGSPVDSGSLHTSFENTFPSTSVSSNAEGLRHHCELRPVRPQYRQTVPRLESGMRRLFGETTHAKLRQPSEERLLPSRRKDPAGVPVVPGQARSNKPKSPYAPVDTISKGRDSGPVRAQGKRRARDDQAGDVAGYPRSERPIKRLRQRFLEESLHEKPRNSADNDVAEHPAQEAHRIADHPSRMSPTLSHKPGRTKNQRNNRRGEVKEYRNVERFIKLPRVQPSPKRAPKSYPGASSDDDRDERFTENAAKERRRHSSLISEMDSSYKPDRPLKPEILESVEIRNMKLPVLATEEDSSPTLQHKPNRSRVVRVITESTESPDELQGAVTVRPPVLSGSTRRAELGGHTATTGLPPSSRDIQPTVFESFRSSKKGKRKNKKAQNSETVSTQQSFGAAFVRVGSSEHHAPSPHQPLEVDVDNVKHTIVLARAANLTTAFEVPLSKVIGIIKGDSSSHKVRLRLNMPGVDRCIDIDFVSMPVKEGFCSLFGSEITIQEKSRDWMNKAFNNAQRENKQSPNGTKRSSENVTEQVPDKQAASIKRVKLTDALRDEHGVAVGRQPSPPEGANPSISAAKPETSEPERSPGRVSKRAAEPSVEIPVKKFAPSMSTRAMSRRPTSTTTTVVCDDSDDELAEQPLPEAHANKWDKPLVYPLVGKKKAEVDVYDLERLRENEFLNDNLIGFYIRFLEEHLDRTNKEMAKKVYFFNTFFHDTLMKVPRGKRGINYEGVQKWTRTVDIFSHDYVVVPINESAHCLPGIAEENPAPGEPAEGKKEPSTPPESQVQEVPETPEPEIIPQKDNRDEKPTESEPAREELARQSLASMSLVDESVKDRSNENSGVDEEWPELEESSVSSPRGLPIRETPVRPDAKDARQLLEPSAKPRKQKAKRGPRYEACQPIIITFDSLNVSRSPTISSLREYLCREAKSKKGIEINKNSIKGMRAQDIPLQPNYSDCGLYLLAYLEKFVQDPEVFVRKILQKQMDQVDDWPPLRSGLLRYRLRKFLDALYDEQEQLKSQKISDHDTMADKKPICYLLGGPVSANEKRGKASPGAVTSPENRVLDTNPERYAETDVEAPSQENHKETKVPSPIVDVKGPRPRGADTSKQSAEGDVVLVADSQPDITLSANHPPSKSPHRSPELGVQPRVVIDIKDAAEGQGPEDTVTVVPVQTQVRGTP
ncbi:cysteine proteinase, partial [Aspergillus ibericus CBS 121593]